MIATTPLKNPHIRQAQTAKPTQARSTEATQPNVRVSSRSLIRALFLAMAVFVFGGLFSGCLGNMLDDPIKAQGDAKAQIDGSSKDADAGPPKPDADLGPKTDADAKIADRGPDQTQPDGPKPGDGPKPDTTDGTIPNEAGTDGPIGDLPIPTEGGAKEAGPNEAGTDLPVGDAGKCQTVTVPIDFSKGTPTNVDTKTSPLYSFLDYVAWTQQWSASSGQPPTSSSSTWTAWTLTNPAGGTAKLLADPATSKQAYVLSSAATGNVLYICGTPSWSTSGGIFEVDVRVQQNVGDGRACNVNVKTGTYQTRLNLFPTYFALTPPQSSPLKYTFDLKTLPKTLQMNWNSTTTNVQQPGSTTALLTKTLSLPNSTNNVCFGDELTTAGSDAVVYLYGMRLYNKGPKRPHQATGSIVTASYAFNAAAQNPSLSYTANPNGATLIMYSDTGSGWQPITSGNISGTGPSIKFKVDLAAGGTGNINSPTLNHTATLTYKVCPTSG